MNWDRSGEGSRLGGGVRGPDAGFGDPVGNQWSAPLFPLY